jgi:hypothetical protein
MTSFKFSQFEHCFRMLINYSIGKHLLRQFKECYTMSENSKDSTHFDQLTKQNFQHTSFISGQASNKSSFSF